MANSAKINTDPAKPIQEGKIPRALDFDTGRSRIPEDSTHLPEDRLIYFPGQEEANLPERVDIENVFPNKNESEGKAQN